MTSKSPVSADQTPTRSGVATRAATPAKRRPKSPPTSVPRHDPAANQVIVWLLEGQRPEHIAQAFAELFPKTDYAATLQAAYAHFETIATAAPDCLRGWCLESYAELYRRMYQDGDYAGALKAVRELMLFADTPR